MILVMSKGTSNPHETCEVQRSLLQQEGVHLLEQERHSKSRVTRTSMHKRYYRRVIKHAYTIMLSNILTP